MKNKILPYGRQWITEEDIQGVVDVLKASNLTQGPEVEKFEHALAKACGAKYAVAVNSGTAALHIAYMAAGINPGDEVISSPITFVASTNAALYVGAKPVFADIEADTAIIDTNEVRKKMTSKTRAIVPVHFAGQVADLETLRKIADEATQKNGKKVYLIDDACHAIGAEYKNSMVGSGTYTDMSCLSFHPVKHITTGEGGAVLTNELSLYKKLLMLRSHGITRDQDVLEDKSTQPWGYEQHMLGYNYRLTDIQSVLGRSQLKKLPSFLARRREIAAQYDKAFKDIKGIRTLSKNTNAEHAYHLYVILLDFDAHGGRSKVMMDLREIGLVTQVHYIPVHTQPYYKKTLGTKVGDFPKAEAYYRECLSIPMFPEMDNADVERVIKTFRDLVS